MLTDRQIEIIKIVLSAKTITKETFSCYDIAKLLQQAGEVAEDNDVRVVVNKIMWLDFSDGYVSSDGIDYKPYEKENNTEQDEDIDENGNFFVTFGDKDDTYKPDTGSEVADFLITAVMEMQKGGKKYYNKDDDTELFPRSINSSVMDKPLKIQSKNRVSIPKKMINSYFTTTSIFLYRKLGMVAITPIENNQYLLDQGFSGPKKVWNNKEKDFRFAVKNYKNAKISMYDPMYDYVLLTLY